jgi:hypothetical protein
MEPSWKRRSRLARASVSRQVPRLHPSHESQDLARGEIEGVECQAELVALHQGKEAIGAVLGPLDHDGVPSPPDLGFHERRPLPQDRKLISLVLEQPAIGAPRYREGLLGVVKEFDVAGAARCLQNLVEGRRAGDIALAAANAGLG